MVPQVALLLGKPPKDGTIVAEVIGLLDGEGVGCTVLLPHEQDGDSAVAVAQEAVIQEADLLVHRGLSGPDLELVSTLDRAGRPLCNPWGGIRHLADRAATHDAIEAVGVPTPGVRVVATWSEVLELAAVRDVVVKGVHGGGRGRGVLAVPLPTEAPVEGPYLVEELVRNDGIDRKLYVVGGQVHGLLKPSTLVHRHTTAGEPFAVETTLVELALRVAEGLDLHLLGVDVVIGPAGPVVVDVNAFPGYRGVAGAPESVTVHLLGHLAHRTA